MSSRSKFKKLMASWDLLDYYPKFLELHLDENTAIYLKDNQLENIFGADKYSDVIKFKLGVKKYKEENNLTEIDSDSNKVASTIIETLESLKDHNLSMMEYIKDQNITMIESFKNQNVTIMETLKNINSEMFKTLVDQSRSTHDLIHSYVSKADMVLDWIDEQKKRNFDTNISLDSCSTNLKRSFNERDDTNDDEEGTTLNIKIVRNLVDPFYKNCIVNEQFASSEARDNFVQDVFNYCDKHGISMDSKLMKFISKCVHQILANEDEEDYYFVHEGRRGGKLLHKRDYRQRKSKKFKSLDSNESQLASIMEQSSEEPSFSNVADDILKLLDKAVIDYKNITDLEWSELSDMRFKDINSASKRGEIVQLFKKWPSYKYDAKYVMSDFDKMFPNQRYRLRKTWTNFFSKSIPLLLINIKDKDCLGFLKSCEKEFHELDGKEPTDISNYDLLMSIHGYAQPTKSIANPSHKDKKWKFTIKDSQAFTSFLSNSVSNFEEKLQTLKIRNVEYKLSTNVVIGGIDHEDHARQYIVVYDDIRYKFDSILEAMECAMAIHFVFSIKFQEQSLNFWKMIQGCFYDIPLENPTTVIVKENIRMLKNIL